jgi:ABC-type sugar transport system ATPase subunit
MKKLPPKTNITLGIRPENVIIDERGLGDGIGEVVSVEVLGDKNLIHFDIDCAHPLIALVDATKKPNLGEKLVLKLREDKIFLFDKESGERIYP